MKEGWKYKKLKDVATFTRGLTYSKNDEVEVSNNIVLRSNNVDLSTGKLKKMTPVDAIRSGEIGERFRKKREHICFY